VHLGRPHWIFEEIKQKIEYPKNLPQDALYKPATINWGGSLEILKYFKEPVEVITPKQKEIVDFIWGSPYVKNPEEIRELFQITEDMFRSSYLPCDRENPIMLCQLFDYIEKGNMELSEDLLKYAKRLGYSSNWIRFIKLLLLIKEERFAEAEKVAKSLSKNTKGFLKEKVDNILKFLHNNEKEIKLSIKKELVSLYPKSKFYSFIRPNFPWRG